MDPIDVVLIGRWYDRLQAAVASVDLRLMFSCGY